MTEKEKMSAGMLYRMDDELRADSERGKSLVRQFNRCDDRNKRMDIIRGLFKSVGENAYIEPDLFCDYGCNVSVGDNFYANTGLIILDQCDVKIGDNVMIGPRVGIYCAGHPIDAGVRNSLLEFGKPITIGSNVWIGGNTVITPGVSIGDNAVIGAGSVVTKNIPSNVVAAGNPCRVLRAITEQDKKYWSEKAEIHDN